MPAAIVLRKTGAPEELLMEQITLGAPGAGEVHLRHTAIGVNFHDVYVRNGSYQTLTLPAIPGIEAFGVVETIGPDVRNCRPGDRVAYIEPRYGAYAEERLIDAQRLVALPDDIDDRVIAATLLKGLTARMLLTQLRELRAGETCLVHAAAGGVGRILSQWANQTGARVIGTVGSAEKAQIALQHGCDHAIQYRAQDFAREVASITGGAGVHVVYDSVGRDTFEGSLKCLRARGLLASFGQSSGAVPPFAPSALAGKSLCVWRPVIFDYIDEPRVMHESSAILFRALREGAIRGASARSYPLSQASDAHALLESRRAPGSIILEP